MKTILDGLWVPDQAPHHSVIGLTGSGKSYLVTRGILSLVPFDNVVIIDVKGDDPTLRGYGKPVTKLPSRWDLPVIRLSRPKPREHWYRLVVSPDWVKARAQVREVLTRVYDEGHWIVVVDETRFLTDPRVPGLNLRPEVEQLWLRGRSREVCLVAMTQAPRWVPGSFYDQPSFVWIGRINDEVAQKRLREIGGLSRDQLPTIQSLKKRQWLFLAEGGDIQAKTGMVA